MAPRTLTDDILRAAYLDRQTLQVLKPATSILPLWDDPETGRPIVLAWDRDELWVGAAADFTGRESRPFDEPIRVVKLVTGKVYTLGLERSLALVLAARWELSATVTYRATYAAKPDKVTERDLRVLSVAQGRYIFISALKSLAGTPRGEKVPVKSLRQFKLMGVERVELLPETPFGWVDGEGYQLQASAEQTSRTPTPDEAPNDGAPDKS